MPRNLDTRVELIVPVEDRAARDDILDAIERCLVDDEGAWDLGPERTWVRRTPGPSPRRAARAHDRPRGARSRGVLTPADRDAAEAIAGIQSTRRRGATGARELLAAVDADVQVKAWWHAAGVNAARLHMNDHSWVHIQIVLNIALRHGPSAVPRAA